MQIIKNQRWCEKAIGLGVYKQKSAEIFLKMGLTFPLCW